MGIAIGIFNNSHFKTKDENRFYAVDFIFEEVIKMVNATC